MFACACMRHEHPPLRPCPPCPRVGAEWRTWSGRAKLAGAACNSASRSHPSRHAKLHPDVALCPAGPDGARALPSAPRLTRSPCCTRAACPGALAATRPRGVAPAPRRREIWLEVCAHGVELLLEADERAARRLRPARTRRLRPVSRPAIEPRAAPAHPPCTPCGALSQALISLRLSRAGRRRRTSTTGTRS